MVNQLSVVEPIHILPDVEQNWAFLTKHLPFSLAVRELMRLQALSQVGGLAKPILDVGCGDGLFWESIIRSNKNKDPKSLSGLLGVDVSANELTLASVRINQRGGQVLSADICSTSPLGSMEGERFRTVIANCSLEHVSRIESALRNIHAMLEEGGRFMLFVPVPRWTDTLRFKRFCEKFSHRVAGLFAGSMDGFFQHNHLYPAEVWRFLLGGIGFEVVDVVGVGSKAANSVFEHFLPTAFLSFLYKMVFRKYPSLRLSMGTSARIERFLRDLNSGAVLTRDLENTDLVEYFIICQKRPTTSSTIK